MEAQALSVDDVGRPDVAFAVAASPLSRDELVPDWSLVARSLPNREVISSTSVKFAWRSGGSGNTGGMSTRLDAVRDGDQVRLEVELAPDDPLGQLRGLRAATRHLDAWQREAIGRAREGGTSGR